MKSITRKNVSNQMVEKIANLATIGYTEEEAREEMDLWLIENTPFGISIDELLDYAEDVYNDFDWAAEEY
jgi:hypothetical protein